MRTISTAQEAAIASASRSSRFKVEVYDGSSWIDLGNLCGLDWVTSIEYGESVSDTMANATVYVHTRHRDLSISPLATSSVINSSAVLLALNNSVRISAAVMPRYVLPGSSDLFYVFKGEIDKVDIGAEKTMIRCLGQGQALADAFIESERHYASEAGTDVEDVIQDILDEWAAGTTLYSITGTAITPFQVADSPGWAVIKHSDRPQRREPVLDAIRSYAEAIGWECRYIWNSSTSDFQLTLFEPDYAKVAIDRTFTKDQYITLGDLSSDRSRVRNYAIVSYYDTAGRPKVVSSTDAASVAKYRRRFMEYAEERGSQIDDPTEAQALADSIIARLKEPIVSHTAEIQFFPWVELGDLIRWEANNVQIDSDIDVAVESISHRIEASGLATTQLACRGVPYAAALKLIGRQAANSKTKIGLRNNMGGRIIDPYHGNHNFDSYGAY